MPNQLKGEMLRKSKADRKSFAQMPRNELYVLLDGLKSAHNVGTILRLSDALLVKKVFICGNGALPPSKRIKRSSIGAEKWVPFEHCEKALPTAQALKNQGIKLVAAEIADESMEYTAFVSKEPTCLILGNENSGVSAELLEIADVVLHLPMLGMCNSVNVSTAAGVLLYHLYEQRRKQE